MPFKSKMDRSEYMKKYREAHKDKCKEYRRKWRQAHKNDAERKAKEAAYNKAYREKQKIMKAPPTTRTIIIDSLL